MSPENLSMAQFALLGLVLVAGAGLLGWWLRGFRSGTRRQAVDAFESELVRAAGRARERARLEKVQLETRLARLHGEHMGCRRRIGRLERQVRDRAASIERLTDDLARARIGRTAAGNGGNGNGSARRGLAIRMDDNGRSKGVPSWLVAAEGAKDDLQTIRGVGPIVEQRLNRLGICQFRQLARLTPKHVDWVASKINIVAGRILHDEWAKQARALHFRKYNVRL